MSYELQLIDTNCNNCIHMVRDLEKYKQSEQFHRKIQEDEFNAWFEKTRKDAYRLLRNYQEENAEALFFQLKKAKFQFDKSFCSVNYGNCSKLNKPVSFIPETCQPQNQNCFKHRKDIQ